MVGRCERGKKKTGSSIFSSRLLQHSLRNHQTAEKNCIVKKYKQAKDTGRTGKKAQRFESSLLLRHTPRPHLSESATFPLTLSVPHYSSRELPRYRRFGPVVQCLLLKDDFDAFAVTDLEQRVQSRGTSDVGGGFFELGERKVKGAKTGTCLSIEERLQGTEQVGASLVRRTEEPEVLLVIPVGCEEVRMEVGIDVIENALSSRPEDVVERRMRVIEEVKVEADRVKLVHAVDEVRRIDKVLSVPMTIGEVLKRWESSGKEDAFRFEVNINETKLEEIRENEG